MTESEYLIRALIGLLDEVTRNGGRMPASDDVGQLIEHLEQWLRSHDTPRHKRKAFSVIKGGRHAN